MNDLQTDGAAEPERAVPERISIATRREYLDAFDALLAGAQRELYLFDPDLEQLQLNASARSEALAAFLRRSALTRLHIVVHDDKHLAHHCPRLADLIALFSTNVAIRRTDGDAARAQDCFVIADAADCVRRPVAAQLRGVIIRNDPNEAALMLERFGQIWDSSIPAAPPTTIGI